ncbi:hypothetical protein [Falsiroseomonas oryzae]|uniref:hypothetical protein n=1 Tax=Falsiroseomonas oryzae TaxID=2766473 RepID=UPI0022EAF288|nr:hypothetical protein [Roseomonas sp. MO-31]
MAERIVDGRSRTPKAAAEALALELLSLGDLRIFSATLGASEHDLTPAASESRVRIRRWLDSTAKRLAEGYTPVRRRLEFQARTTALVRAGRAKGVATRLLTEPQPRDPWQVRAERVAAQLDELAWQARHVAFTLRYGAARNETTYRSLLAWAGDLLAKSRWPPV